MGCGLRAAFHAADCGVVMTVNGLTSLGATVDLAVLNCCANPSCGRVTITHSAAPRIQAARAFVFKFDSIVNSFQIGSNGGLSGAQLLRESELRQGYNHTQRGTEDPGGACVRV